MKTKLVLAISVILAVVAACAKSNTSTLSVSATTRSQALVAATPSATTGLDVGNGISVTRLQLVVRKLKLEGQLAGTTAGTSVAGPTMTEPGPDGQTDMEKEQDDADEPVLGPLLIDLSGTALTNDITPAMEALVPQGTFQEIKFVIGPLSAGQAGADPTKFADVMSRHASIIIDGAVNGIPFSFSSALIAEIEKEGKFTVSASSVNNVTVSIDPRSWFAGPDNSTLNPAEPGNRSSIEENIKRSLDVFQDDDRNAQNDED